MYTRDHLYIGGQWVPSTTTAQIEVRSPLTEEVIGRTPDGSVADIDRAVAAARQAFDDGPWSRLSVAERAAFVARFADVYERRIREFPPLITAQNGLPLSQTEASGAYPLLFLRYYAELAATFPFEELREGPLFRSVVRSLPVGVVGAITPWNGPQYLLFAKLAPALLAGCTVVHKPAPETPLDAYITAEILEEAGLPPGVVNIVPGGREVGEHLVTHPGVDKISFTGSAAAGRRIAGLCGERMKRISLELGGKSAAIILDDADLDATLAALRFATFGMNGEMCGAQTRILASRTRHDEVVDGLIELASSLQVGDPFDLTTEIGPLVTARQRSVVEGYVTLGQDEGAKVAVGGARPADLEKGWFYQPTVIVNADNSMRVAREEIFGPVVVVIPYDDVDDAIAIANDSDYGLAGSVWTSDAAAGLDLSARIRAGTFGVNRRGVDPAAPFGGFKASGLGRELGPEGLHQFLELQSVSLPTDFIAS